MIPEKDAQAEAASGAGFQPAEGGADIPETGGLRTDSEPGPAPGPVVAAGLAEQDSTRDAPPDPVKVLEDRLLRVTADFQNYQKRMKRDREQWIEGALRRVLTDLLPIADHFERALDAARGEPKDYQAMVAGVEKIREALVSFLGSHSVQAFDSVGVAFDPRFHEAVVCEEAEPPDIVLEELEKGYRMGDVVLRTAKVKVSRPPQGG